MPSFSFLLLSAYLHLIWTIELVNGGLLTHVTGQWTEELHQLQLTLVHQVKGRVSKRAVNFDGRKWWIDPNRSDAPLTGPRDEIIHEQLLKLKQCSSKMDMAGKWTRQDLLEELKYFLTKVYPKRPLKLNVGGMRLSHSFGCFFLAKRLKPQYIIESGVSTGHSTWLLRQAVPSAEIFSLDVTHEKLRYMDNRTNYFIGKDFRKKGYKIRDFMDFGKMDWSFIADKSSTLVFIDDHQSALRRVHEARKAGFKHIIFDDNWMPLTGDCYSSKTICDESAGFAMRDPNVNVTGVLVDDDFAIAKRWISLQEHRQNREYLLSVMKFYYESPPWTEN